MRQSAGAPPETKQAAAAPPGQLADPAGTDRAPYRAQDRLVFPAIVAAIVFSAIVAIVTGFLA